MAFFRDPIVLAKRAAERRGGFRHLVALGEAPAGSVGSLGVHGEPPWIGGRLNRLIK